MAKYFEATANRSNIASSAISPFVCRRQSGTLMFTTRKLGRRYCAQRRQQSAYLVPQGFSSVPTKSRPSRRFLFFFLLLLRTSTWRALGVGALRVWPAAVPSTNSSSLIPLRARLFELHRNHTIAQSRKLKSPTLFRDWRGWLRCRKKWGKKR